MKMIICPLFICFHVIVNLFYCEGPYHSPYAIPTIVPCLALLKSLALPLPPLSYPAIGIAAWIPRSADLVTEISTSALLPSRLSELKSSPRQFNLANTYPKSVTESRPTPPEHRGLSRRRDPGRRNIRVYRRYAFAHPHWTHLSPSSVPGNCAVPEASASEASCCQAMAIGVTVFGPVRF